jgi:hypothetical protein
MPHAGGFVNLGCVDAFDFFQLVYQVYGPLTLVLTSAAMTQYQAICRFLLRTKDATFLLRDVWRDLQVWNGLSYLRLEMWVSRVVGRGLILSLILGAMLAEMGARKTLFLRRDLQGRWLRELWRCKQGIYVVDCCTSVLPLQGGCREQLHEVKLSESPCCTQGSDDLPKSSDSGLPFREFVLRAILPLNLNFTYRAYMPVQTFDLHVFREQQERLWGVQSRPC